MPSAVEPTTLGDEARLLEAIGDRDMTRWETLVAEAESDAARTALQTETVSAAHSLLSGDVGTTSQVRDIF